jgi:hypothetical protein
MAQAVAVVIQAQAVMVAQPLAALAALAQVIHIQDQP